MMITLESDIPSVPDDDCLIQVVKHESWLGKNDLPPPILVNAQS